MIFGKTSTSARGKRLEKYIHVSVAVHLDTVATKTPPDQPVIDK
jgi:hypothetical protein